MPAKEKTPSRAYPAGKRLSPQEISRSVQRAPRDRGGKITCWDARVWAGCPKTGATCARSHEPIKGIANLHWTVQAQLIKRGGLKSGTKVDPA